MISVFSIDIGRYICCVDVDINIGTLSQRRVAHVYIYVIYIISGIVVALLDVRI